MSQKTVGGFAIRDYQSEAIDSLRAEIGRCIKSGQKPRVILQGQCGFGKMEWDENLIPTPSGDKRMGDISVGDFVYGACGSPTKVTGVFPQGLVPLFDVHFSDGTHVRCGKEHLWMTLDTSGKRKVRTTGEISLLKLKSERIGCNSRHYGIPVQGPACGVSRELPVHPYILGVLIGDGSLTNGGVRWCNNDTWIGGKIQDLCPPGHEVKRHDVIGRASWWSIVSTSRGNEISSWISRLGLRGLLSFQKAIPQEYLLSSVSQRVDLLHGLMDTDGTFSSISEYSTSSPELASGFAGLVRSLGCTAKISSRTPVYTYKGEKRKGRLAFRVSFRCPEWLQPFSLPRKLDRYVFKEIGHCKKIDRVELSGEGLATCIQVEAKDSLYLTKDYTVTHNTTISSWVMDQAMQRDSKCMFIASGRQLIFQKSNRLAQCGIHHGVMMADCGAFIDPEHASEVKLSTEGFQSIVASKDTLVSRIERGRISGVKRDLVIVDEVHLATSGVWREVLEYNPDAIVIGLSATPAKGDGTGLGDFYNGIVCGASHRRLIDEGYMVPCRAFSPYMVDMKGVKVNPETGEYVMDQVSEIYSQPDLVGDIVSYWHKLAEGRRTIVFASSVEHAIALKHEFNKGKDWLGLPPVPADYVDASTPPHERKKLYDDLIKGDLKVLTNFGVLRCLDQETEILTSSGWVGKDAMLESHKVANYDSGEITFEEPLRIIRRPVAKGETAVSVSGLRANVRVTSDHDMLFATNRTVGSLKKKKAIDIVGKSGQLPVSGHAKPFDVTVVEDATAKSSIKRRVTSNAYALRSRNPGLSKEESRRIARQRIEYRGQLKRKSPGELSDSECMLIGFLNGDSCSRKAKAGDSVLSASQSDRCIEIRKWIERTLDKCGINYSRHTTECPSGFNSHSFRLSRGTGWGPQSVGGYYQIEPYINKKEGSELWWGLSENQWKLFLHGYHLADGEHGNSLDNPKSKRITSTHKKKLDLVQAICSCRGMESRIRRCKKRGESHSSIWRIHVHEDKELFHLGNDRFIESEFGNDEEVWCVTTRTGNVVTRRQGVVTIMGNCGIDFPPVECIQLAVSMNSLNSYLQSVGRGFRISPDTGKVDCLVIDHGGNIYKHGWPQWDRDWSLDATSRIQDRGIIRLDGEEADREPICCPKCGAMREHGPSCPNCGYRHMKQGLKVRTVTGELVEIKEKEAPRSGGKTEKQKRWLSILAICANRGFPYRTAVAMFVKEFGHEPSVFDVGPGAPRERRDDLVRNIWPNFVRRKSGSGKKRSK